MNRIRTVLLLGCCLLLAACSQGIGDQQQGTTPEVGNTPSGQSQQAEEQQSPAEPSDTTMEDPDPESSEEDPDHESSPSDEEEINAEPQYHMNQVYRIVPNNESVSEKVVLLTFDDGPKDETMINNMIDVLDKHDAKAIFFVNGYRVKQNPDLLKIIDDRGQIIGNHAWDHIDLKKEGPESARQQIEDVQEIVMDTVANGRDSSALRSVRVEIR
ncbi:peptidoglycan N-acetylglucosamine deacetylase [Paenibacillus sp. JCM 10914]|nr:peptidoglycan N-acetylglucosamine deacetylase [Paenibacillus sp. JCM 10914]